MKTTGVELPNDIDKYIYDQFVEGRVLTSIEFDEAEVKEAITIATQIINILRFFTSDRIDLYCRDVHIEMV